MGMTRREMRMALVKRGFTDRAQGEAGVGRKKLIVSIK
jgi:hypothetical protein